MTTMTDFGEAEARAKLEELHDAVGGRKGGHPFYVAHFRTNSGTYYWGWNWDLPKNHPGSKMEPGKGWLEIQASGRTIWHPPVEQAGRPPAQALAKMEHVRSMNGTWLAKNSWHIAWNHRRQAWGWDKGKTPTYHDFDVSKGWIEVGPGYNWHWHPPAAETGPKFPQAEEFINRLKEISPFPSGTVVYYHKLHEERPPQERTWYAREPDISWHIRPGGLTGKWQTTSTSHMEKTLLRGELRQLLPAAEAETGPVRTEDTDESPQPDRVTQLQRIRMRKILRFARSLYADPQPEPGYEPTLFQLVQDVVTLDAALAATPYGSEDTSSEEAVRAVAAALEKGGLGHHAGTVLMAVQENWEATQKDEVI